MPTTTGNLLWSTHRARAVLVDKGYMGLSSELRAIMPRKKPRLGNMAPNDVWRNRRVSSDGVIVENFFGRVCSLWKVSYATFK